MASAGVRLYGPRIAERLEFYVAGGAGAKVRNYDLPTADPEAEFALNFGGGVDLRIARPVRLRLDVRDNLSWLDPAVSGLGTEAQHDILLSAGLSIQIPLSRPRR